MKKVFILVFALLFTIFSGCSKKSRLTNSTLVLRISPASVSMVAGSTQTFTAFGRTPASDNPDINPEWSLSPESLGTLNSLKGKSVVFTAGSSPGSGKIIAREGDVRADATITVGSGGSGGGTTLTFYSDSGLINIFGTPDIFTWQKNIPLQTSIEQSDGGGPPGDSTKYQRIGDDDSEWFGAGIVINKVGGNATPTNLSSYSSGNSLKFYIRLGRALSGAENIKIEIEYGDSTPGDKATVNLGPGNGFNSASTSWQEITIPLTSFSGVDYTKILLPFEITAENLTSALTFDWDYVRWSP